MAPSILINPTLEACSRATGQTINPAANVGSQPLMTTQATRTPLLLQFAFARSRCGTGRLQDWSTDRHVRAFLASDPVRADKAVRAPVGSGCPALCVEYLTGEVDHVNELTFQSTNHTHVGGCAAA